MEEKFSFTILTKTSSYIGLGHFNRCKILAEELIKRGNKVVLYVYGKKFTNEKKYKWIKFIENKKNNFDRSNLCIVDTYNFKGSFYKKLKKYFDNIVIFDDRNRNNIPNDVSGIINPNIYFKKKKIKIKYFGGKKYILLRKEFVKFKKTKQKNYIFLCFGGSDPLNQMPRFTKLLLKVTDSHIYAVLGPKFRNNAFLKKFKKEKRLKIFKNPKKISNLMSQSQFAVTSSGSMLYELIKLKVKTICVSLASNQIDLAQYFAKKKLVKYLGSYSNINNQKMILKLKKFQTNLKKLKIDNLSNIIPDNGAENLAKDISIWLSKKNYNQIKK